MTKNSVDQFIVPIVVTLSVVSFVCFGWLFPFAVLMVVGLAAIQVGFHGFRSTGYSLFGDLRLTGKLAHILGGISIAIGILWEAMLIAFLIFGFSLVP